MKVSKRERYTYHSSPEADNLIQHLVGEVANLVGMIVPEERLHALVLIGGYGRGEGGVRSEGGVERPNNNLDFLLISQGARPEESRAWQDSVESAFGTLQDRYGISLDFSVISGESLQRSSCRIMWYDMRCGHKTILGDPSFVPSLNRFRLENVPSWDVHNLLVNRGTLLVINDCLPLNDASPEVVQIRTRHTVKAVIGYGDALLYSQGHYHWSYAEKQKRMRSLDSVDKDFREIYDLAASHRFRPGERIPQRLLEAREVRSLCESVHQVCEARRLRVSGLAWDRYLETVLSQSIWEDSSPRGWARTVRNFCRRSSPASLSLSRRGASSEAQIGFAGRLALRSVSAQRLLGFLFPAVAYHDCSASFRETAACLLMSDDSSPLRLRAAFLRAWGETVDKNFKRFLGRYNISLDSIGAPS